MRIIEDIWEIMRIWTNKNGDYKSSQHKEGMEPRMIGDFTDILLTNIQQADLPNLSSLSPKSGFMISWSLVLNKRSVIYVYTCEQQGQQRISQMSYSQSCACLICDFKVEKVSIKKLIKTLSGSIYSCSWFDVYLVNIQIETSNDHLPQLPITSAITPADFLWTDLDLGNLESFEGNVYVCKSLYLD